MQQPGGRSWGRKAIGSWTLAIMFIWAIACGVASGQPVMLDQEGPDFEPPPPPKPIILVDATGQPIKGAKLEDANSDEPADPMEDEFPLKVFKHPEYGQAVIRPNWPPGQSATTTVPLVRIGSPAAERELKGTVVDPDGRPVEGVEIRCSQVRTPGQGLISGDEARVLTDAHGKFRLYLHDRNPRQERGSLIPVNSNYHIQIVPSRDSGFFPNIGVFPNTKEALITLTRANIPASFTALDAQDKPIDDDKQAAQLQIAYSPPGTLERIMLSRTYLQNQVMLAPGAYFLYGSWDYAPIWIDSALFTDLAPGLDQPPFRAVFRLQDSITYTGQVISAVTGEPMPGVFVAAMTGTADHQLSELSDANWDALHNLSDSPKLDDPAIEPVRTTMGLEGLVRTDKQGRYELTPERGRSPYAILAFDRNVIPFQRRVGVMGEPVAHRIDVKPLALAPAARVRVRFVVPEGKNAYAMPEWTFDRADAPKWAEFYWAKELHNQTDFACRAWLRRNDSEVVYVPADVRFKLIFSVPQDEFVIDRTPDNLLLKPGQEIDIGDIGLAPAVPVLVRVVDSRGKPVEGVPVRRYYENGSGTVAYNSDEKGLVRFYIKPGFSGRFESSEARTQLILAAVVPTSQPGTRPATQPTQPATQPTTRPTIRPTTRPTTQPTTRPATQPAARTTTQQAIGSTTRPDTQPTTRPMTQPASQPAARPVPKSTRWLVPQVRFELAGNEPPAEPYVLVLTDEQIAKVLGDRINATTRPAK